MICSGPAAGLLEKFLELIQQSWSPVEIETLGKAARSALL